MKMSAVPPALPLRQPIQLTELPVKLKLALVPAMFEVAVEPSLQTRASLWGVQLPEYVIFESSYSSYLLPGVMTSNASTTTRAAVEAAFFRPVDWIVSVWVVSASPVAANTIGW